MRIVQLVVDHVWPKNKPVESSNKIIKIETDEMMTPSTNITIDSSNVVFIETVNGLWVKIETSETAFITVTSTPPEDYEETI